MAYTTTGKDFTDYVSAGSPGTPLNKANLDVNGDAIDEIQALYGKAGAGAASIAGTLTTSGALTVSAGGAAITGNSTVTGTLGGITQLNVDNLRLDGNTLSSTSGAVTVAPLAGQGVAVTTSGAGNFAVNTTELVVDTGVGVGVATATPLSTNGGLDISSGGLSLIVGASNGASTRTNGVDKYARMGIPNYLTAEEPMTLLYGIASAAVNLLHLGGGDASTNAATNIRFYTAANATTTTGTKRAEIGASGGFQILDTAALGTPTGGAIFYSVSGEMYVKDTAGNQTQLSPHDPETNEIYTHSFNSFTGKRVKVYPEREVDRTIVTYEEPTEDWTTVKTAYYEGLFRQEKAEVVKEIVEVDGETIEVHYTTEEIDAAWAGAEGEAYRAANVPPEPAWIDATLKLNPFSVRYEGE